MPFRSLMWKKKLSPPAAGVMKPKPFSGKKEKTVPALSAPSVAVASCGVRLGGCRICEFRFHKPAVGQLVLPANSDHSAV